MSKNGKLFDSKTKPVPRIRPELDIIPIQNNGDSYLYFHDVLGYAADNFALDRNVGPLLSLLDGQNSIEELKPYLGKGVSDDQLLEYIQFLDRNRILLTGYFQEFAEEVEAEYESSPIHRSVTAGGSYPAEPDAVRSWLDEAFRGDETEPADSPRGLYAPHIDPRVGLESYVKAFAPIRHLKPKRVVILATSHYAGMYPDLYENKPFILTRKNFELPLGTIRADQEAVDELEAEGEKLGISTRDRGHRIEHSIELHLLFLSYLWDHDYRVVPVLVRGFDELFYKPDGHLGTQVDRFGEHLARQYADDPDTFFLISGDLAHFGHKFGDEQPAREQFNEVKSFDRLFMEQARKGDREGLLQLVGEDHDPYRICGFAPLYTYLSMMPGPEGTQLSYDLWDESERESAVTFGSILYR